MQVLLAHKNNLNVHYNVKKHEFCLLQYTVDSTNSSENDEFELTINEASAVLDSWIVDMDRHQQ